MITVTENASKKIQSLIEESGFTTPYLRVSVKGFQFINPNASRTCGCGESFAV